MKFEIDYKTGMITTEECIRHDEVNDTHEPSIFPFHLEQILQAVKKTQEKLVNKQIQEIQDSKNIPFPEIKNPIELQKFVKKELKRHEKIEQNQKIVDAILPLLNYESNLQLFGGTTQDTPNERYYKNEIYLIYKQKIEESTGKDIKELYY